MVVKYLSRIIWVTIAVVMWARLSLHAAVAFVVVTFICDKALHFITTYVNVRLCGGDPELYWAVVYRQTSPPSQAMVLFFFVDILGSLAIPFLVAAAIMRLFS